MNSSWKLTFTYLKEILIGKIVVVRFFFVAYIWAQAVGSKYLQKYIFQNLMI